LNEAVLRRICSPQAKPSTMCRTLQHQKLKAQSQDLIQFHLARKIAAA
jgi:hypothetical protein